MSDSSNLVHLELTDLPGALRRIGSAWPAGISLRTADLPADLPLIADLYNAAFDRAEPGKVTPEEIAHLTYHPGLSHKGILLALAGDTAVGLVVGSLDLTAPEEASRRGAIELLAVRPGYRRRGVGRALVHAALRWLVSQGVSRVSASAEGPDVLTVLARYGFKPIAAGSPEQSADSPEGGHS